MLGGSEFSLYPILHEGMKSQSISAPAPTRSGAPGALRGSHPERRSDSAPGQPSGAALRQRSDPWSASAPTALQQKSEISRTDEKGWL